MSIPKLRKSKIKLNVVIFYKVQTLTNFYVPMPGIYFMKADEKNM